MDETSWTAEWVAESECGNILRFAVGALRPGLNEAACRITRDTGQSLCVVVQSNYGSHAITEIMRPRKLSDIVIVYRGRCIYGDVVEGQFLPLDRVGPFREMHQLNENCSIIIGSLGYCVAKGASNLREVTHPYATLIKVYSTEAGLLLQYEDRHLELQSVTVSC